MKTSKPISTISFNTAPYLTLKLNEMLRTHILSKWYFIEHLPEDDEGGKKTHYHVYMEPAKMVLTDWIRDNLKELDPDKPDKPKSCLAFQSSNFANWYLYAIHDKTFLASKGQSRKYHYTDDQIVASDPDDLTFDIRSVDVTSVYGAFKQMENAINRGDTFTDFVRQGKVPIQQINAFEKAWFLISSSSTNRNGKAGHQMSVDTETGEVLEDYTDKKSGIPDKVDISSEDFDLILNGGDSNEK